MRERESTGLGLALTKKEVFNKIGLFSEDYSIYYCDVDFSNKVKKAGYKIMFSKCKCWHKKEEIETFSEKQFINFIKDKMIFMKNNSISYPLFLIGFLFLYIPFTIVSKPSFFLILLKKILKKDF